MTGVHRVRRTLGKVMPILAGPTISSFSAPENYCHSRISLVAKSPHGFFELTSSAQSITSTLYEFQGEVNRDDTGKITLLFFSALITVK